MTEERPLYTQERLRMVSHDLEAEVFHREVVKQEQEQLRRKLVAQHEEEIERLRWIIKEKEVEHNNEKIRMRWEHAEEVRACMRAVVVIRRGEYSWRGECKAVCCVQG